MKRKEAEKLLAALIFDDLDEASKTELLTYLQNDNELRERLADMRMAVKVASDTVQQGPDPVLGKRRLKHLAKLAKHGRTRPKFFTPPRLAAAAAIFIIGIVGLAVLLPSLEKASEKGVPLARLTNKIETDYEERGERVPAYGRGSYDVPTGPSSRRQSRRTADTPSREGLYAFDPPADRPEVAWSDTIRDSTIATDGRHFAKVKDSFGIRGPQTSIRSGYPQPFGSPGLTEKWDAAGSTSESSFESKPHSGIREGSNYSNTRSYADMGSSAVSGGTMPPPPGGVGNGGLYSSYEGGVRVLDSIAGHPGGGHGGMGYGGGMMGRGQGQSPGGGIFGAYGGDKVGQTPGGEYGGMGGYGGGRGGFVSTGRDGGMGRYGTGTMGPSTGSGDSSSRYDGVDHSKALSSDISGITSDVTGSASGDKVVVRARSYNGDIDFKGGEEIILFNRQPVDTSADGDGIPATGKYSITNGKAPAFKIDGFVEHKDGGFKSRIIDNFDAYVEKESGPSPVGIVTGEPVTARKPESTTLPSAKPLSQAQSQPMDYVLGLPQQPGIKLQTEKSSLPHVSLEDIKNSERYRDWFVVENARKKNEADFRKAGDELGTTTTYQYTPEKDRVPALATVRATGRDMVRQGEVAEKAEEEPMDETSADHGVVTIIDCDFEEHIATRVEAQDQIQRLLTEADRADIPEYSGTDLSKLGDKKKIWKVPIFGDVPLVGGLFRSEGKKRQLSEEEKRRIVDLNFSISQPEGELDIAAILAQPLDAEHIIDQSSTIDEQSGVDLVTMQGGEDEPELPPSSRFKLVPVNPWVMTERDFFSTFALDVDTASYTLCRRYIRGGFLPPAGAVRMEEFINYFNYHYPQRTNPTFAVHAEAAPSPFSRQEANLTLLKIGVKARTIGRDQRKAAHLIFVVDASASMGQPDRLPLVQHALDLLVHQLSEVDRVSLISCASEARLHLEAVPASERDRIRQAIYSIQPAGPTNLLAGLKLGYATARNAFAPKQINHVVLCSDGVANVGQTEADAVLEEVAADRKQGITITCVGVGYGSYNDVLLEALANRGDGSYVFLDSVRQARQVFVRQLAATLQTVAKDARIQVEFNPNRVRRYRLIGYENRDIEDKRFRDDTIDAGEVGSGQCSTALYELELIGQPSADRQADLGTVFVRYRNADTGQIEEISSRLSSVIVRRPSVAEAPRFFLAAGAARFAEILRQSEHAQNGNLMDVFRVVEQVSLALPLDRDVRELAELIRKSEHLPRSP